MITSITSSRIDFILAGTEYRVTGESSDRNVYLVFKSSVKIKQGSVYETIPKGEQRETILQTLKKLADADKIPLGFQ